MLIFNFGYVFFLFECSISELTNMNEKEEVLLEQFVNLPQLKQVITDRDELVKSIEELASKMSKKKKEHVSAFWELNPLK